MTQNEKVDQAIAQVCTVDGEFQQAAADFLWAVARLAREVDNLQDGDKGSPDVAFVVRVLLVDVGDNAFFLRHRVPLMAGMLMALNAWEDANAWQHVKDVVRRGHAHVLRDALTELLLLVAFLLGGHGHQREHSLSIRALFLKGEDWAREVMREEEVDPIELSAALSARRRERGKLAGTKRCENCGMPSVANEGEVCSECGKEGD